MKIEQVTRFCMLFLFACLLTACSGSERGDAGPESTVLLAGDPAAPASGALVNTAPQPAATDDIVNGLILTRLDVAIAADATVGQVNAALGTVGGSIDSMRAGLPAVTVAIPRQSGQEGLQGLADVLQAQPGIRLVLLAREANLNVAPPAPADAEADFGYLQKVHFPAAWNARTAAADDQCVNSKVSVIVADKFHRPIDVLYTEFATQVPGVTNLGVGSVDSANLEGYHGYDVLTTLAAKLDATVPTGANPFPDCLDVKAVQIKGLTPDGISNVIDAALATTTGKAVLNASFSFVDQCGNIQDGTPCTPATLTAEKAHARAARGAKMRKLLFPVRDRVLVTSVAGNQADAAVSSIYPGTKLARFSSELNVAATADSAMSFVTDAALWEPTSPCTTPPCFPSLTAGPADVARLGALLADLGQASAPRAGNVVIVGSMDNSFNPSSFSEPGADLFAIGEGIPRLLVGVPTEGTSVAAPQVAGLATYLWMLSPELRARPVQDTIAAIKANASTDGLINAYSTVLSLDAPVAVTPATARARLAILDIDGDKDFDLADIQAFHNAFVNSGLVLEPTAPDYSRFDLNGDGFTGGSRATRMDLDPTGSTQFGQPVLLNATAMVGGIERTFNEIAVTDARALCYYANTALFTAHTSTDLNTRDVLLSDLCSPVVLDTQFPAQISAPTALTVTVQVPDANGQLGPAPNLLVELAPTCAIVNPTSGRTDANGQLSAIVTPSAGCSSVSVDVTARAEANTAPLARNTVTASVATAIGNRISLQTRTCGVQVTGMQGFAQTFSDAENCVAFDNTASNVPAPPTFTPGSLTLAGAAEGIYSYRAEYLETLSKPEAETNSISGGGFTSKSHVESIQLQPGQSAPSERVFPFSSSLMSFHISEDGPFLLTISGQASTSGPSGSARADLNVSFGGFEPPFAVELNVPDSRSFSFTKLVGGGVDPTTGISRVSDVRLGLSTFAIVFANTGGPVVADAEISLTVTFERVP